MWTVSSLKTGVADFGLVSQGGRPHQTTRQQIFPAPRDQGSTIPFPVPRRREDLGETIPTSRDDIPRWRDDMIVNVAIADLHFRRSLHCGFEIARIQQKPVEIVGKRGILYATPLPSAARRRYVRALQGSKDLCRQLLTGWLSGDPLHKTPFAESC